MRNNEACFELEREGVTLRPSLQPLCGPRAAAYAGQGTQSGSGRGRCGPRQRGPRARRRRSLAAHGLEVIPGPRQWLHEAGDVGALSRGDRSDDAEAALRVGDGRDETSFTA